MAQRTPSPEALFAYAGEKLAARVRRGQSVCAAYSGGLDSTVLLDLLARHREAIGYSLSALHVNHGLSANADAWAASCERFAAGLDVPIRVEKVQVDRSHASGLEAAARAARHAVFARAGTDFLALAHHRDDQAETVLLQALRGTGMRGLSAMAEARPVEGATWLRPLLDATREALEAYARSRGLAWVEDDSNAGTAFDRNFLRHAVLPLIASRFPQARESLAKLARHAATANAIVEALAREDATRASEGEGLSAERLGALDAPRRANVLRHFLAAHGLAMPGEARLADMARQLVGARDDARVLLLHGGAALVRHQGVIVVEEAPGEGEPWTVAWTGERVVALGGKLGEVRFRDAAGGGIPLDRISAGRWHFGPRAGGERLRLHAAGPSRTLKNLLREHAVPVWRRSCLPLLFDGDNLVWVPGIGIAAEYASPGPGLVPQYVSPA
jgi:tRNA(Ile)-lysidine synthase